MSSQIQTGDLVLPESLEQLRIVAVDDSASTSNNTDSAQNPFRSNTSNVVNEQQVIEQSYDSIQFPLTFFHVLTNIDKITDS